MFMRVTSLPSGRGITAPSVQSRPNRDIQYAFINALTHQQLLIRSKICPNGWKLTVQRAHMREHAAERLSLDSGLNDNHVVNY